MYIFEEKQRPGANQTDSVGPINRLHASAVSVCDAKPVVNKDYNQYMKMRNNREGMKNDKKVGWKSVKMIKTGANLSVENYKQQNKSAFSIMPKHNRDDVKDIQSGVKRQKVTRIRGKRW